MAIRKYGSARRGDGEVTAVEQDGISKQAAAPWDERDDQELAAENKPDTIRRDLDDV